ncbi:MFS transporter [Georgenia sp. AZ-5]|uniref:MFS transporter n=1 Tax=Georgenia sp. AZ-5 TaxID=3367526 RepID=UPI0037548FAA
MRARAGAAGPAAGLGLLVAAVVLIGLNLRGPIVGVPPLLGRISGELGLTAAAAGLLTSLPLLSFAILSPFVGGVVRRLGIDRTLLVSLLLLIAAVSLRPWDGWVGLLLGTAVVGVAITLGNVVVPVLVRRDAPGHVSAVMALSTSAYGVGQGLASFVAVPLADEVGWRGSIAAPALLILLALAVWVVRMRRAALAGAGAGLAGPEGAAADSAFPQHAAAADARSAGHGATAGAGARPAGTTAAATARTWSHVWRQGEAWWLAAFFGLQASLFYAAATWIPTQLRETAGVSEVTAGTAVSVFHLVGIAGTLLVPAAIRVLGGASRVAAVVGALWAVFFAGLALAVDAWVVWAVVGGLTQGAGIGLGLTLIAMRPVDAAYGRYVSGMVQGVGYALAAVAPVLVGWLARSTGGWAAPTAVLAAAGLAMAVTGLRAGADRHIG